MRFMKNVISSCIVVLFMLASCSLWQPKHREGVVAEVNGQSLTCAELAEITRAATSSEDSAVMAEAYIYQWAADILEYAEARDRANEEIDRLVEDYRRSLYIHAYEQKIVARHRPKQWADTLVERIYKQQQSQLRLTESIVKGVLVIVPKGTPKIDQLKSWLYKLTDANIEKIEKYAFQYATGYEYFPAQWCSVNQVILRLPLESNILEERMDKNKQIVLEDSISVYVLQITDKCHSGDVMPIEYAREKIEQILFTQWQVEYMQEERKKMYEEALRFNKLKRYE